jgi:hypothetical protein
MLPDGMKWEGQWINDRKHGSGRLTYPDGGSLEGTWLNDKCNGLCQVKNEKGTTMVIYKDDMAVKCKQGLNEMDKLYVVFSITMLILFWGCIPLAIVLYDFNYLHIMWVWLFYISWSCCIHKATFFIRGLTVLQDIYPAISSAISAAP